MESVTGWWVCALLLALLAGTIFGADLIGDGLTDDCEVHGQMGWGGKRFSCEALKNG